MKHTKTFILLLLTTGIVMYTAGCKSKKNTTSSAPPSSPPPTSTNTAVPVTVAKSADGIYSPGEEELTAIQAKYKETTMAQLQEGYYLYTTGACVNCHKPKNIYRYDEPQWNGILAKMTDMAHLTDGQKNAVTKYVFAIKAVQTK